MNKKLIEPSFSNKVIDKNQLKQLIVWAFRNYGIARAANMVDKLKDLGFYYATKAGISLSLEDLRIPPAKRQLLTKTMKSISDADYLYKRGDITIVERFHKVIDTWNNSSESLKKEIIKYFKNTDPLNSIYMMAFSGARANISQVRQLVGMRGLMSDPHGQIIDLPISSNFREGLTITDYFISSYGARKGLVDTALRTADSGYLTRRLVDVAQDVIIREDNCGTSKGILLEDILDNQKILIDLKQRLLGRILAEDLFEQKSSNLIATTDQVIDSQVLEKIISTKNVKVLVRSPITCNSIGSVCQMCYGWNLAHNRKVDLGEAIGIIAAQSIGEPGTQLTMRTFHTGGVFTGEFVEQIYSPVDSIIVFAPNSSIVNSRTRHGSLAYLAQKKIKIFFKNKHDNNILDSLNINKGTLILVRNKEHVRAKQVIAEYPLTNRLITEKAQKHIITDLSGDIHFTDLTIEEIEDREQMFLSAQSGGLIWVLSGHVYNIPSIAKILVKVNQHITPGTIIARKKIMSNYKGYIKLVHKNNELLNQEVKIIVASQIFSNIKLYSDIDDNGKNYILQTQDNDKFLLCIEPYQNIVDNQVFGNLISDTYKTNTGGIIKYLDLPISTQKQNSNTPYYDITGPGYILWIAEETHEINKDASLIFVNGGDFIESGTEILKNIFAKNSGIVEVLKKDGVVKEIIIKPGVVHKINISDTEVLKFKNKGFLRPGETITQNIHTDKLVYWEHMKLKNENYILVRPVIVYSISEKHYDFSYTEKSFGTNIISLKLVRRITFRDGERIKSVNGIELIKTQLVTKFHTDISQLSCFFCPDVLDRNFTYQLKFIVSDTLSIKDNNVHQDKDIFNHTSILVHDNQQVEIGQVIAQTETISNLEGEIGNIQEKLSYDSKLLIISDIDQRTIKLNSNAIIKIKDNDWIRVGDKITDTIVATDSGKVISITKDKIVFRIGRPYLVSNGSILNVNHHDLVKRGDNIATLIFERAKTGDIVQGLPRIEEILEARKKSDNLFNPHILLERKFCFYLNSGLSIYDATRLSLQEVQLHLIKEVQLVYQSQGVDIADKHIEVIVRQMTSKVKIDNGGDSEYLPGEIVELQKIENINKNLVIMKHKLASYHPILLGITKASLNTESFISAASFQETTKVLTEAAISSKLDWLRGLKENVIIGRLIPAGTGFNKYSTNCKNDSLSTNSLNENFEASLRLTDDQASDFEDIIFDDRSARKYSIEDNNWNYLQHNTDII